MKVLDVGCGAGILAESLGRLGMGNILGIDPTPKCIELAEQHLMTDKELSQKITYKNITLEQLIASKDLKNPDEQYDLVTCSEVIEHVDNQSDFLRNLTKLVKPRTGYFFLSSIAKTTESYILTILCKFQMI